MLQEPEPENLRRLILDELDERRATVRELAKVIFGRPTDVGEEWVRRALRTLESAGEVIPDKNSWLRWSEEKEKARQREVQEEQARQRKARRQQKAEQKRAEQERAEQERARRAADEREKAERERVRRESFEANWNAMFDTMDKPSTSRTGDLEKLAKFLGMLGSDYDGERLNAAAAAENLRRKLGMTWPELLGLGKGPWRPTTQGGG